MLMGKKMTCVCKFCVGSLFNAYRHKNGRYCKQNFEGSETFIVDVISDRNQKAARRRLTSSAALCRICV